MSEIDPNEPTLAADVGRRSGGSILSALLGLLFLTAFLPLVLTSR